MSVPPGAISDKTFTFTSPVPNAGAYDVTVATPPAGYTCTLGNNAGTVNGANVTNVAVSCTPENFTISGKLSTGLLAQILAGASITLNDNGDDPVTINAGNVGDGTFTFAFAINYGSTYDVTVTTPPTGETCTVTNATGTATANVTNVGVSCSTAATSAAYNVNLAVGTDTVVGQIVTDGTIGVLGPANILSWNLTLTGTGVTTNLTSTGGESGFVLAGSDLTATANNLFFNYSGTDSGDFVFQATPPGFGSGDEYWCNNTTITGCSPGVSIVPQAYDDPTAQYGTSVTGNQIIGTAP